MGFARVQNFPTVGLIDGSFRQSLEETGMSFSKEVDLIAAASEVGLLTSPYVFDVEQARNMTARRSGHRRSPYGSNHWRADRRQDGDAALRPPATA